MLGLLFESHKLLHLYDDDGISARKHIKAIGIRVLLNQEKGKLWPSASEFREETSTYKENSTENANIFIYVAFYKIWRLVRVREKSWLL